MKGKITIILPLLLSFFYLHQLEASVIKAIANGNWSSASTWEGGLVPGHADVAVIDGFTISINGSTTVPTGGLKIGELLIKNEDNTKAGPSQLYISSGIKLTILNDLNLNSTSTTKGINVGIANSTTFLQIDGDLNMVASGSGQIEISLIGGSKIGLGGDVNRSNNWGAMIMDPGCALILNGNGIQNIPLTNMADLGQDAFGFGSIEIDKTSDIILNQPLIVEGDLTLTKGRIYSSDTNPVVLQDLGSVTGASSDAYVVGPVVKKGRTSGGSFTFPIGSETSYSPLVVSEMLDISSDYKVSYKAAAEGDPPPYGAVFGINVNNVDPTQYWEIDRVAGDDKVSFTLSWNDAKSSEINSLDSVIVVQLSPSNVWERNGQSAVSGGVGNGVGGTVQSLEGDPPPYGVSLLSIGSGTPQGSLPVELIKFKAGKTNDKVYLEWQTASELNASHYDIQRSADGITFESIGTTKIIRDSETLKEYNYTDVDPMSGTNYYRLKIVDKDASFEYSDLQSVTFMDVPVILISPNPVSAFVSIEIDTKNQQNAVLEVYDRAGKQLYRSDVNFNDGRFQISTDEINVNAPGTYFLRVTGSTSSKMIKFLKIN